MTLLERDAEIAALDALVREARQGSGRVAHEESVAVLEDSIAQLEQRAERYAAAARPRTDARSGAAALTASERRVAGLAAGSETNRDIAQALFVTPKTVEVHLSNAYRKLGIRSRRELGAARAA